jgi:predicted phage-related endonuclease
MRNHLIGGTDAATLLGLGRISPVVLYLRLTGELPDTFEGNDATEAGTFFEDGTVVPLAKKRHGLDLVRPAHQTLALPDDPRIGASFDFEVRGTNELADAKLTGMAGDWDPATRRIPLHIEAQMQFQMAVRRANQIPTPLVHVLALFTPGYAFEDFVVVEDQQVGAELVARAREMLARVDRREPPDPNTAADARLIYRGRQGQVHQADAGEVELLREMSELRAQAKQIEERIEVLQDTLLPAWGDATEIVDERGELVATWRPHRAFDTDAFRAAHPTEYLQSLRQEFSREAAERLLGKKTVDRFLRDQVPGVRQKRPLVLKIKGSKP